MIRRKWENLPEECLVNIFTRVGMGSLILVVPFVCKSWNNATLSPFCWECLVFSEIRGVFRRYIICFVRLVGNRIVDEYELSDFSLLSLVKFVIDRSQGHCAVFKLPYMESSSIVEILKYIADKCPALKSLDLTSMLDCDKGSQEIIPKLMGKWKDLKELKLRTHKNLTSILAQINRNCKNFESLYLQFDGVYDDGGAMAIVEHLPKVKCLYLSHLSIPRKNLLCILETCKELVVLDVRGIRGFEVDEEILKLTSHIKTFKHKGCSTLGRFHVGDFF